MSDKTPDKVKVPHSILGFRTFWRIFMHTVSDFKVTGRENWPPEGQRFILASNHMSYFDSTAMAAAIIYNISGFTAAKYKKHYLRPIFQMGAPVWIEQDSPDRKALMLGIKIIKQDNPFFIAPEGTRSKTQSLQEGKDGTAFVATRTNSPIIPTAVWGTEQVFKKLRPQVRLHFGKPFYLPAGRAKGEQLTAYTERIMCAIAALLPEKYHGYYAGNPLIEEMAQIVR